MWDIKSLVCRVIFLLSVLWEMLKEKSASSTQSVWARAEQFARSRINVHAEERILLNLFYTNLRLAGESRLGQWLHIRTNRSKCVKNFLVSTIQAWISGTRKRELRISPRFIFVHHWKTQYVCRSWPGPSTLLKPNIIDDSGCMLDCSNQRWY